MSADIFYKTLSTIGKIASPQLNAYIEIDIYAKPIYYSFRFEQEQGLDLNGIYLKLINCVTNFNGTFPWIMHRYGWHKNYVIEPLEFYRIRRLGGEEGIEKSLGTAEYQKIMTTCIEESTLLCSFILESFSDKSL